MANQGNDIRFETEIKIFNAAYNQFLLFGYHGTRIRYIAKEAKVLPAAVHYYFRSKEKLYVKIIYQVINDIFDNEQEGIGNRGEYTRQKWFLQTELYNNQDLLCKSLQELYLNKWDAKLSKIREYLETKT
ncbi:TetR/AcrR family transcriptional regulator [Draconibacterium sediminis]|uniref:TetR/AcrR family transcriptional regulator n=1 Tax=Draconibacterium sediminis TaxID=1544798 RepID=UPI0006980DF3|nr:TetR family transcriptional regulator [Draconibacterium sediminis]